MEGLEEGEER